MIIKCKMCGGDLAYTEDSNVCECEFCGTMQTILSPDNEKKANLFNRANRLRMNNEFDKASTIYEQLVAEFPVEAEAYWGLCLCAYGIEYVDDPATGKKKPTCHRTITASIMEDINFQSACDYADSVARKLYHEEAKEIDRIQQEILSIAQNETSYDVFICYKETDEKGDRTEDSVLAQDIYDTLTTKGMKVFFSRITLEDKLGMQYEPYIFAALSSAKVMLAIGTQYEYYDAVWVKNEWSRFLSMMRTDRSKTLIPCFKGLDAYDMPKEFKGLQAQDMSKLGWMQDLVRGVEKICGFYKKPELSTKSKQPTQKYSRVSDSPNAQSLMDRVYLLMEDGDTYSANVYLNRVLDIDPKYAPAYAAKVCVSCSMRKESELSKATFLYEDNPDWQKALRFASPEQKAIYESYIAEVRERVAIQIRNFTHDCAVAMAVDPNANFQQIDQELKDYSHSCMCSSVKHADGNRRGNNKENEQKFLHAVQTNEPGSITEEAYKAAAAMFKSIKDEYAAANAKSCLKLAEEARQKKIYKTAVETYNIKHYNACDLDELANIFTSIRQYKDSESQAKKCTDEAEKIRSSLYSHIINQMKTAGNKSQEWLGIQRQLNSRELINYKDVNFLKASADKRYKEAVEAEKQEQHRKDETAKRVQQRSLLKKKMRVFLSILTVVGAVAAVFFVTQVYWPEQERANIYLEAQSLYSKKDFINALNVFKTIRGYKDVDTLLQNDKNLIAAEKQLAADKAAAERAIAEKAAFDAKYAVGNYITFGTYPQTNSNTNEPIEWLILAREDQKALLISRYALDSKKYNDYKSNTSLFSNENSTTWEKCYIRSWLNSSFISKAFSTTELSHIILTNIMPHSTHGLMGGNTTMDKVFLLSESEIYDYFGYSGALSVTSLTQYASEQADINNLRDLLNYNPTARENCCWWLRCPGSSSDTASFINQRGNQSYTIPSLTLAIRPAIWIDLSSFNN